MRNLVLTLILASFIMSCGPSASPILQKKIGDLSTKTSSTSYSISGKFVKPMALEVGQWVSYISNNEGKKSISKTSIVGKEGDAWIIESYSLTESEEGCVQMCISGIDKFTGNPDDLDIKWVKMMKNGQLSIIDGPVLSLTKSFYKKGLTNFGVNVAGSLDGGSVNVPAGTFKGTAKVRSEVSFIGSTYTSDGWYHTSVPISGMVKSTSVENNSTIELLDFNTSGAVKSF
jgi:hypothetical protein